MLSGEPRSGQSHVGASPRVAAIVLAAGASSRMGQPKALLDFDGRACVDLVLDASRASADHIVLVTSPAGAAIRARAGAVIHALNEHPERGMLSSLQAGLAQLPAADAFLIFPVDYPLVPAAEIRRLVEAFATHADKRIFLPSHQRRRGHPVLVDAALAPEYLALGDDATARAVHTAHEHEIAYIETDDDRVLMDMDTPADYQRCLARYRAR
jgi:molybdenum cofactor cytidylyltransferase